MSIDTSTTEGKIAVMQAAIEGKQIQSKPKLENVDWIDNPYPCWQWDGYDYRVAAEPPQPKLVPYTFLSFPENKRKVRLKSTGQFARADVVGDGVIIDESMMGSYSSVSFKAFAERYEWIDGAPCGVETEVQP